MTESCAAFSVTSAIESALAISNPAVYLYPPKLSEQQLLDCGALSCQGGWIGDVYDYTARMYLATDLLYPYKATSNPSDCSPLKVNTNTFETLELKTHISIKFCHLSSVLEIMAYQCMKK